MILTCQKLGLPKPAIEREDAKLMILHKDTGEIEHKAVADLKDIFDEGDVVVLNNTKVFPCKTTC